MPGVATTALVWIPEQDHYEFRGQGKVPRPLSAEDEEQWQALLQACDSCSFQGQSGHLTLRKEARRQGKEYYWYAYRRQGRSLAKRYLGRTNTVTLTRLEAVAQALTPPSTSTSPSPVLPLLRPKLAIPQLHPALVARERLTSLLDAGLERKLTVLSAPAGSGKTTLVSQWVDRLRARPSPLPVAWVALDTGDTDPQRFWRYVITACHVFRAGLGESALRLLGAVSPERLHAQEAALHALLNDLASLSHKGVLILEDIHLISDAQLLRALATFVDYLPPTLHLVLIARHTPPLPLARWRAHDELSELHLPDLRFTLEETQAFFHQVLPFPCSLGMIQHAERRTEGWVTGLRLLTLVLQRLGSEKEAERFLAAFTGGHQFVLEYVVTEVLDRQSERLQQFLLQTCLLERLTPSLCEAVTEREDCAHLLAMLAQSTVFLQPLSENGRETRWYRYHALFAEALQLEARLRLGEEELRRCAHRASIWYEHHGLLDEAVEAAFAAGEATRAATLIEELASLPHLFNADLGREFATLSRWFSHLPEQELRHHPALCFLYAIVLGFRDLSPDRRSQEMLEALLQHAEQMWQAEENTVHLGEIWAFRALLATWQEHLAQAETLAQQALVCLPEKAPIWRGMAHGIVATTALQQGHLQEARHHALRGLALGQQFGQSAATRPSLLILGEVSVEQGALHQATELYQKVLNTSDDDLTDKSSALRGMATLSYERNELVQAEQEARAALEAGKQVVSASRQVHASLVLARTLSARGEPFHAQQVIHTLLLQEWSPLLTWEITACLAELYYAQHDLSATQRWLDTHGSRDEELPLLHQEQTALIRARLLMTQDQGNQALQLLHSWHGVAQECGRSRRLLTIELLMSLAYTRMRQQEQAERLLRQALAEGMKAAFLRVFLDEGPELEELLRALWPTVRKEPYGPYAHRLLLAFARLPDSSPPLSLPLSEALSEQERRVLQLLAAGLSSPEIARTLVISLNTVKTHLKHIFHKLDVHTRTAAVSEARRLGVL
ncbi:MAG TPA: LuxR C-terminal-related transcriptional regulator [Ktedonobacteraceae bacterium]|jgi:LuxR family maltose regulon positive regulatory protein|nr:LuxR C-terminal-related transcriptional regulator [Ktedonobacteraceae bacterium]